MATVNWSLQHFTDTAANFTANNPTLLAGQLGIETDGLTTTPKFKIGDGVTAWNTLPYFYGGSASAQDLNNVLTVGNTTSGQDIVLTDDDKLQIGSTAGRYICYDTNLIQIGLGIVNTNSNDHIVLQDGGGIHVDTTFVELPHLTASRVIATDANNRLSALTGTGILTLTVGAISYDTNTYLTTSAAALAYQPLDADLTSWASVTRASGFDTFTATPSSANLSSLLTDKTGTGVNVFGTNPTFTGYISIDNPSPFHKIDISADTQTGSEAIALTQYTAASATSPQVFLRRARGSLATPTAITNNDDLGYYSFRGHNGSAFVGTRASINARASENWSSIANGTRLRFQVTTNGTISAITPMELLDTGNLHLTLSTSSIYLGNITPSSTNYALGYTAANELSVNAISTMRLRVGGTIYGTLTATSLSLSNYLTLGNVGSDIKLYMQRTGGKNTRLETTTTSTRLYNESDTLMMWTAYNNGSFAPGLTSALATNATDGFLYVPSCAGIPTGVPTAITGKIPIVADSTNNKLYIYSGGAWVALN